MSGHAHPLLQGPFRPGWTVSTVDAIKSPEKHACVAGPFGSSISAKFFVEAGVPIIRGSNLSTGLDRFVSDDFAFISPETAARFSAQTVRSNDLVFTCWGTIGQVGLIPMDGPFDRYVISNKQLKLRVDREIIDPLYAYYFFACRETVQYIRDRAIGSAVPGINLGILKALPVLVPPREDQQRIAEILGAYDDLIEVNRRRVALLEEMARDLFEEWFVRFRFPGHDKTSIEETPHGRVPNGWALLPLTEAAEVAYGYPFKSKAFSTDEDGCRVVRIRDVPEGRTSTWTTEPFDPRYAVTNGDILVGMDGIFHTAIWAGGDAALNQRVARLRPRDGRSHGWAILSALPHIKFFEATISGTTVAHLGAKHLNSIRVLVASPTIQAAADRFLASLDQQSLTIRLANERLAAARDLLLPRLISGQLSVAAAELELAQAA